jgi:acyl-coenzyme A thioesterase PaaI-like protein
MSETHPVLAQVTTGLDGTSSLVVGPEHTAEKVGSGVIPVLATPVMINVIESAALAAAEHLLSEGHQSLDISLDVRHIAATHNGGSASHQGRGTHHLFRGDLPRREEADRRRHA